MPEHRNISSVGNPRLGIVIVAFGNELNFEKLLLILAKEKRSGDLYSIIDNHPKHGCAKIAEKIKSVDSVTRSDNIGFAAAANLGASRINSQVDLLLFLNPDILPAKGSITKMRYEADPNWSAWMGLITLPDGTINSAGNLVHLSGLSWCDFYGQPTKIIKKNQEVDVLSGACLMIKRDVWDQIGGFYEDYFMYFEDADISMTMRQMNLKLGIIPSAHFEHDYIFEKGKYKWFYLERNRYIFIVRQWPLSVLILMLPLWLIIEIGLWLVSIVQLRFWLRIKSVASFIWMLPRILKSRKLIQKNNVISSAEFISYLYPNLSSPLLGRISKSKLINSLFRFCYRLMQKFFRS